MQQPFVVPGAALHDEMRLFVRAGIPARDVLRMATRDAAVALGWSELGTVRRGSPADLIVCARDRVFSRVASDVLARLSMRRLASAFTN